MGLFNSQYRCTVLYTINYVIRSYNMHIMGMSALPDMHVCQEAEGIHIRQSMSAQVITNVLHFWNSQNLPKP